MLTWTQRADGWYSNGFRIELAAPFRWLLLDSEHTPAVVGPEVTPLAVARTLTECKREAELLTAARQRAEVRRRHIVTLLMVLAAAPMLFVGSANTKIVVGAIVAFLAVRSVSVILGTLLPQAFGEQHEVFYQ